MFSDKLALQIAAAAARAGIPEAGMLAIVEVETSGNPLEADGRTPNFLFERHVFHRELSARQPAKLVHAVKMGMAIPKWSPATQYKDQSKSSSKLSLLARAKAIDEDCALRSCSWGLPQIMGNECQEVGFPAAKGMVDFLTDGSPQSHLDLMVRFLKSRNLISAMERRDWAYVALRYNGAGYRKNQYDTRLAAADRKWERRLPVLKGQPAPQDWPEEHLDRDQIEGIQRKLRELAYPEVGNPDGKWGDKTSAAVFAFQKHEGLSATGHFDDATQRALDIAYARPVPEERVNATVPDLREAGSSTIATADSMSTIGKIKAIGGGAIGAGAIAEQASTALSTTQEAVDKVGQAKTLGGSIHDMLQPLLGHPVVILLGLALAIGGYFVIRYANQIKTARLADHQDGTHAGTVKED
jgi:hypothetical protein